MSTAPGTQTASEADEDSPYRRDNYWGEVVPSDDADGDLDHCRPGGTDPAAYLAHQQLLALTEPICERQQHSPPWNGGRLAELFAFVFDGECIDGRGDQLHRERGEQPLSEPELYLPKQTEVRGRLIDYRQHRLRRRYNPETGYVNFGETTSTGIPEVSFETYEQAVHNYLWQNGVQVTNVDDWLAYARRLFYDQQLSSKEALEVFIRKKRQFDQRDIDQIPNA